MRWTTGISRNHQLHMKQSSVGQRSLLITGYLMGVKTLRGNPRAMKEDLRKTTCAES